MRYPETAKVNNRLFKAIKLFGGNINASNPKMTMINKYRKVENDSNR